MFDLSLEDIFTAGAFEYALKRLKRTALGLDGLSAEDICSDVFYTELKSEIFSLSYSPQPLKRAFIPKETKDELRKLAVPSLKDKFAQNILTRELSGYFDKSFSNRSYAYRNGKSYANAIFRARDFLQIFSFAVKTDIKDFFENIDHEKLLEILRANIRDSRIIRLIELWIKNGIFERFDYRAHAKGVHQGDVLSPLLSNIYLNQMDKFNVPEVVLNFTGTRSRGVFTPRVLLLGQNSENGWRGAFNRRALSNDENKFYIELALDEDEREIIIRREWSRFPDLCEKLIFIKDGERLENNQAREEIERILPLNFLQFFVFDGEEIEAMADEVSTELKDKIQSMLNIAVLDRLSDQINKAERELISQSNMASKIKSDLDLCEGRQKSEEERFQNAKINIKFYEAQVSDKSATITAKKKELEGKIRSNSKESEGLQNAKDAAMADLQRAKQSIAEFGGEILFAGLDEFFLELLSRI